MPYLIYLIFRGFIFLFRIIPFWLIYRFSDILYLLLFYLIGYRKKVAEENLRNSFPEKSNLELKAIKKAFYRYFCDLLLESVKGFSMSKSEIIRRHKVINPEIVNNYFDLKKSVLAVTAHYGNWEWGSFSGSVQIRHSVYAFYKQIGNPFIDAYVRKARAKFNTTLLSIKGTFDSFQKHKDDLIAYIMVADQNPSNDNDCYWVNFLHRDTACLHGPEKYARLYNFPVFYIDIQRIRRGYYEMNLSLLAEDPSKLPNGKITALYFKKLEEIIIQKPEFWLWTHRRWKHSRGSA